MPSMPTQSDRSRILLVSCYELGHQPAGIALPMALLERSGYAVDTMDVSVEGFDKERVKRAGFVGISVPMHTALRLGWRVAREIRSLNSDCHICFYGLYATLNSEYLLDTVADSVIGGEFEHALVQLVERVLSQRSTCGDTVSTKSHSESVLARINFVTPNRKALVPLERYARLEYNSTEHLVGYVEASRGCLHHCKHCPIPSVYDGRFFVVPKEVVLEDIRGLVESGARHITFGDPDFLNGPGHSLAITSAMHEEFPDLTFDFTAKVEHILKHQKLLPEFAGSGCIFIVSAVESLSDTVLERLDKGHNRNDVIEALGITRRTGIHLRPTFVSFTPWTTIDDYIDVLEFIETEGLIDHVDPVQYSIRLLVPPGSLLLAENADSNRWLGRLVQESFFYEWKHPDPRMDDLYSRVREIVEQAAGSKEIAGETFQAILETAYSVRGDRATTRSARMVDPGRLRPPRLTEAWFC